MAQSLADDDVDMKTKSHSSNFNVYRLEGTDGKYSTLVEAQKIIRSKGAKSGKTFNLLMADISFSMCRAWPIVIDCWNDFIKDKLTGTTKLFVFNDNVYFLRSDTILYQKDEAHGGTNITMALQKVRHEVDNCEEKFVQVFIITDGDHGMGSPFPETEINQMRVPPGKTVNVYLLGITNSFPVNYSIDIRSRLHNGSANTPSLYWAKNLDDITEQMKAIAEDMEMCGVKMTLNHKGYILPGLDSTPTIQPGEWMYYPKPPEEIVDLKVTIGSKEEDILKDVKEANVCILLDFLYPQWNSALIKQHRSKLHVPKETFKLMDSLFEINLNKLKNICCSGNQVSIRDRMNRKNFRTYELRYTTLKNMSRTVIDVEGRYSNEIELANNILKSTVSGKKYDTKNLKIRGHGQDEYDRDNAEFRKIYEESQAAITALPPPDPDDCCRVTMSSTLSDLQDEEFQLILDEGKYDVLKNFTMTGIPAFAPVRDASQINVWTLTISHMLVTPFTILSQRAIEEKVRVEGSDNALGFADKDVLMKSDDEKSRFNIIIPIVPADACVVLKRVVRSNLYAMMATFCILKNPHIIDYSAHLAALACAWVRSIADHPPAHRPAYVTERLVNVVATAELYMERKTVVTYLEAILTEPRQALMTESKDMFDGHTLKCESLIKPLFFLGLRKEKVTASQLQVLLILLLTEYVGRCLSNYKMNEKDPTPFTDFFVLDLNDPKKKEEMSMNISQAFIDEFKASHQNLLKEFYAPENIQKAIKVFIDSKKATLEDQVFDMISLNLNMDKVKRLRNVASCGDVRFYSFRAWAQEMGVPEDEINAAYAPSQLLVYVYEALCNRNSKDRLSKEPASHAECREKIKINVKKEYGKTLLQVIKKKISEVIMSEWRKEYFTIHEHLVKPLSPEQIVAQAQARGIDVTQDTFNQKYRYDTKCKLMRNACQIPACPFYLVPNRSFNQHLAAERVTGEFPHSLHVVSKEMCDGSVKKVLKEIITGSHSGRKNRKKCPISEQQTIQKLTREIQELLQIYKLSLTTI